MKNRLLFPLVALLSLMPLAANAASTFSDVGNHYAHEGAINYLAEHGIVKGYSDGTFRPTQKINRAEFLKIVLEADKTKFTAPCPEGEFPDVSPSDWFVIYTLHAKCFGIIQGYPDGTFRPAKTINFVEAVKIIANVFDIPSSSTNVWYEGYVRALADKKAIPLSITSFNQEITRGEMAEVIYRLLVPGQRSGKTYDELNGVIDTSSRSPAELIDLLNRTDWTDKVLLDTLCATAKRPDIVAITGGKHPPCNFMDAYLWHEWRDRYWPNWEKTSSHLGNTENTPTQPLSIGDVTAPVTMTMFTDYQVGSAYSFWVHTYPRLDEDFIQTGKLRILVRHNPLSFNSMARFAAGIVECARLTDERAALSLHLAMATRKNPWENDLENWFTNHLKTQSTLNGDTLRECEASGAAESRIEADMALNKGYETSGIPQFLLKTATDERRILGAKDAYYFIDVIQELLDAR